MIKIIWVILIFSLSVYGADSFGDVNNVFVSWLNGNLGKLLALIGVMIIFLGILMESMNGGNVWRPAMMKIGVVPLIAGGMVGIANTFFNVGISVF